MENLIFSLNATVPIFLLMVLGFILKKLGLIDDVFASKMNKFVFLVPLPVLLFEDLSTVDFAEVWNLKFVLFCFAATLICIALAAAVSFLWKDKSIQGEFIQASYRSSAALLGIEMCIRDSTIGTLCYSIVTAAAVTAVCLLIAYPTAYVLARSGLKRGPVLLMLFILPMWINFTLRITALKEVLTVIEGNLSLHPFLNTVIAMTYDFLPFMILPLYTTLLELDENLLEAARDLGAGETEVFLRVTLPLSMPGVVSGITMTFLPAMTNYVILDMMYNSTYIMGSLIGSYFNIYDWNNGSMISLILFGLICLVSWITGRNSENDAENRGAVL